MLLLFIVVLKVTRYLTLFLVFHYLFREKIFIILVTISTLLKM